MQFFANRKLLTLPDDSQLRWIFIKNLVQRAEGVFLWLRLVVDSLNRGLENGDDVVVLEERLNDLPSDLSALYHDILGRHGDDATRYQKQAALFFRLALFTSFEPGLVLSSLTITGVVHPGLVC
jgi:hypothetical protein